MSCRHPNCPPQPCPCPSCRHRTPLCGYDRHCAAAARRGSAGSPFLCRPQPHQILTAAGQPVCLLCHLTCPRLYPGPSPHCLLAPAPASAAASSTPSHSLEKVVNVIQLAFHQRVIPQLHNHAPFYQALYETHQRRLGAGWQLAPAPRPLAPLDKILRRPYVSASPARSPEEGQRQRARWRAWRKSRDRERWGPARRREVGRPLHTAFPEAKMCKLGA